RRGTAEGPGEQLGHHLDDRLRDVLRSRPGWQRRERHGHDRCRLWQFRGPSVGTTMHSDRTSLATILQAAGAAGAALILSGCMTQSQEAPPLTGPSGFGLSITVAASPDVVQRDASSRSTIRVNLRDGVSNAPISQRRVVVTTDVGSLSAGEVVTD